MNEKERLIEKAIKEPLDFTPTDLNQLLPLIEFSDMRIMIKRIYDMNEEGLLEASDATTGALGTLNKSSTEKRIANYYKRIKKKIRYDGNNKIVLAEGDSWFQFPMFVDDIIDWLNKSDHLAVYSIAYGGDWITNILYEGKYITELPIHQPDAFMISGGGNDMVGGNRLAMMVDHNVNYSRRTVEELNDLPDIEGHEQDIFNGSSYLKKEFYAFTNVIKLQYHTIFSGIEKSGKFPNMMILTQGYDYAIPSWKRKFDWRYLHKSLMNSVVDSGRWLARPLHIKAIPEKDQHPIVKAMIFEVNEVLKAIAKKYTNVYHIDCRDIAGGSKGWFDELHLKSHVYKKVAYAYRIMIDGSIAQSHPEIWKNVQTEKVLRVKDVA